ncbi:MAG: hypothetical protein IT583_07805 [Verrucomicrobia bacterium]|nr:hypothetical protein [Verrucomicrobiota bacterium]
MKRDIEWIEKLDDGVKRTVRIAISMNKGIKWQFKRSDEERWDYDTPASPDDWQALDEKVAALYNRRRATHEELELVRAQRKQHG